MALLKTKRQPKKVNPHADFKKLKLLVTVVNRNKAEFYVDFLSGFEVNFQFTADRKSVV